MVVHGVPDRHVHNPLAPAQRTLGPPPARNKPAKPSQPTRCPRTPRPRPASRANAGRASSQTRKDPTAARWPAAPPPPTPTPRSQCRTCAPCTSAKMGTCPSLPHAASCAVERRRRLQLMVVHGVPDPH
eukprot:465039-Prorocentrum_lima.AAC.1